MKKLLTTLLSIGIIGAVQAQIINPANYQIKFPTQVPHGKIYITAYDGKDTLQQALELRTNYLTSMVSRLKVYDSTTVEDPITFIQTTKKVDHLMECTFKVDINGHIVSIKCGKIDRELHNDLRRNTIVSERTIYDLTSSFDSDKLYNFQPSQVGRFITVIFKW